MTLKPPPELPALPYDAIREPFETAFVSAINNTERQWPARWANLPGANSIVERILRTCWNTWNSIRFLCAQEPPNPARKVEYSLSAAPLTRTILDSVFTVVFLFHDLAPRSAWYTKSGWKEVSEELERHRSLYGTDPGWQEWLTGYGAFLEDLKKLCTLTAEEIADPSRIPWWPIPGQMLRHKDLSEERRLFLQFLNDWHYKALSSQAHLSLPGLITRSQALMSAAKDEADREWYLDKQRSDAIMVSIVLSLALLSEIEIECQYGLSERLKYVWTVMSGFAGMAKELYDRRYQRRL